ncbi:RNA-directed DNA polymerase, eukaryota [Tanacetum coccineum]
MLWDYLSLAISNWKCEVVVMGDFNEVRTNSERFGSVFNVQGAVAFNMFISNAGLEEVPLGGYSFTWCHKFATKMSKLDRFLVSESLMSSCPNISALTLDRYLSNHRPILLREINYDYGPIPFRLFHYWFEMKEKIRAWSNKKKKSSNNSRVLLKDELAELDAILDKGAGNDDVVNNRNNVINVLQEMEKLQSMEAAQKAKIKWAIEGDENSKYYHGILNKKRSQLTIRGILVEGSWIDSPNIVKNEFLSHFKKRFDKPQRRRTHINMTFPHMITSDQNTDLESDVTREEIKRAVWDCGIDKSPGPDGFTFVFYLRFWNVIEKDMVKAVRFFFNYGSFLKGGNSSFIALIPKNPDANMVMDFRPISLIGSLYKIIAKILANRLVVVLGDIVNEVQSAFVADRQILDGPFILNEVVQWCKAKKKQAMIFKVDFEKAYDSVRWDYLDEVMKKFGFGERIESGRLMSRIQSWNEIVDRVAARLSKWKMKTLLIGGRLTLLKSVLGSMPIYHLSIFKVPMKVLHSIESIRCQFFNGNDRLDKKPIWVKWKSVLASKEKGGLGVSSLYALNRVLLFKWVLRFFTQDSSLWARVIKAIHGTDEKIGKSTKSIYPSVWLDIVHEVEKLKGHGIDLMFPRLYALEACKNLSVASKLSQSSLDFSFRRAPRGGVEQSQLAAMLSKLDGVSLVNLRDRWRWSLVGSGEFSIASVRKSIDDKTLPEVSTKSRWIKPVPIKVNIHA